jgi:hypothetical protein
MISGGESAKPHSGRLRELTDNVIEERRQLSTPISVPSVRKEEKNKERLLADLKRLFSNTVYLNSVNYGYILE